jgi:hypothetical protein
VRTIKHPLSGALYDLTSTGTICVSKNGRSGEFTQHGVWLANRFQQAADALSDQAHEEATR